MTLKRYLRREQMNPCGWPDWPWDWNIYPHVGKYSTHRAFGWGNVNNAFLILWMDGNFESSKTGKRCDVDFFFGAHNSFYPAGCINRSVHGGVGQWRCLWNRVIWETKPLGGTKNNGGTKSGVRGVFIPYLLPCSTFPKTMFSYFLILIAMDTKRGGQWLEGWI